MKKRRIATSPVVSHVRKTTKGKQTVEIGTYRLRVLILTDRVARDLIDDVLEPEIVTSTTFPGAEELPSLADADENCGRILVEGTLGSVGNTSQHEKAK